MIVAKQLTKSEKSQNKLSLTYRQHGGKERYIMPKATIFKKMRETKDGKKVFPTFFAYLTNQETGERDCFTTKFTNEMKEKINAVDFPIVANIHGNISRETYADDEGTVLTHEVLWITAIMDIEPFVDNSLSQYE